MSATLGGLIKDLRLQKNISQLEIAFALGWKEPSRLSRIEQGKNASPPRFLIENIMDAMKLSEEERNQLLMLGNYLPTKEEITETKAKVEKLIDDWRFPVTCMDYTWRLMFANKEAYDLFQVPEEQQKILEQHYPNMVEIMFDPEFLLNRTVKPNKIEERKKFLLRILHHFQYAQRSRTREKWYQELVKKMMSNETFRELWPIAQRNNGYHSDIINFARKSLVTDRGKELDFFIFLVPIYADPRFMLELHIPANEGTYQYFNR